MRGKRSIYFLNIKNPNGIVYPNLNGKSNILTPEHFASDEEFEKWKDLSDSMFREEYLSDHSFDNHTVHCISEDVSIVSAEDTLIEKEKSKEQSAEIEKELLFIRLALTETQLRRWIKYRCDGKTQQQIADEEGVNQKSVCKSIKAVKKFLSRWKEM